MKIKPVQVPSVLEAPLRWASRDVWLAVVATVIMGQQCLETDSFLCSGRRRMWNPSACVDEGAKDVARVEAP